MFVNTSCRLIYETSTGSLSIPWQTPSCILPSLSLRGFIPLQSSLFCPLPYTSRSKEPDGLRHEETGFDSCASCIHHATENIKRVLRSYRMLESYPPSVKGHIQLTNCHQRKESPEPVNRQEPEMDPHHAASSSSRSRTAPACTRESTAPPQSHQQASQATTIHGDTAHG